MSQAVQATDEVVWSERLGAHLEASRKHANRRRLDLANQLGVSEETIRLWEKGRVQPSAQHLARLIAMLAIETADWPLREGSAPELPPLAQQLWDEREGRGVTQAEAASVLGVPQTTYAGWETGRSTPGSQSFGVLAEFLGCDDDHVATLCAVPFVVDTSGWPELGRLVGSRREALRLTRSQLAQAVGVSHHSVVAWELGSRTPGAKVLPRLAEALSVDTASLAAAVPRRAVTSALGNLIRVRQRELGLRSADVAALTGATEATVSRWVHGQSRPAPKNLRRLASVLHVPYSSIAEAAGGAL